jgi:hypothetical protein
VDRDCQEGRLRQSCSSSIRQEAGLPSRNLSSQRIDKGLLIGVA